jgi:hypothetical protein
VVIRTLRLAGLAAVASVAALVASGTAQAGLLSNFVRIDSCDGANLTQPFAPWLDYASYKLAPGGDGSLTGWSLSGGAQQVAGGEPWNVSGSATDSLSVPAGGTAVSPTTCVDAAYPDFRFFDVTGTPGSRASVSVLFNGRTIPVGVITPGSQWSPTLPMPTLSAIPGLLDGGSADIQLQFTGLTGSVQVDDVYVDPYHGH